MLKVGDLVQEALPLMAGDAPERIGLVTKIGKHGYFKMLFDKEELVLYNSVRKVKA